MAAGVTAAVLALGVVPVVAAPAASAAPTELFFSEYVEGSSSNKALEIYNGTGAPVDLAAAGYAVRLYFNGSPSSSGTIALTGTVASGAVSKSHAPWPRSPGSSCWTNRSRVSIRSP